MIACVAMAFILACAAYLTWPRKMFEREVLRASWLGGSEYLIRFRHVDGAVRAARGSCSVWHYEPSGDRCDSEEERWLADRWKALEWERVDAEASES